MVFWVLGPAFLPVCDLFSHSLCSTPRSSHIPPCSSLLPCQFALSIFSFLSAPLIYKQALLTISKLHLPIPPHTSTHTAGQSSARQHQGPACARECVYVCACANACAHVCVSMHVCVRVCVIYVAQVSPFSLLSITLFLPVSLSFSLFLHFIFRMFYLFCLSIPLQQTHKRFRIKKTSVI